MTLGAKRASIAIAIVFGVLVLGSFALPTAPFKKLHMTCEGDGRLQSDWVYLGFIPLSTVEMDPKIDATADFMAALKRSGLKVDVGFAGQKPSRAMVMNYLENNTKGYFATSTYEANFKGLEVFYGKQFSASSVGSAPKDTYIMGTLPTR